MDYEKDIEIDHNALDVEWLGQPNLLMRYSRMASDAQRRADLAAEKVKVVKSKLIKAVSENPEEYLGKVKPTVQAIEAFYHSHEDYIAAKEEHIEAVYELNLLQAAVSAIHQRRTALENLVKLMSMEYFIGPRTPRDIDAEMREVFAESNIRTKRSNERVAKEMKRKVARRRRRK